MRSGKDDDGAMSKIRGESVGRFGGGPIGQSPSDGPGAASTWESPPPSLAAVPAVPPSASAAPHVPPTPLPAPPSLPPVPPLAPPFTEFESPSHAIWIAASSA